MSNFMRIITVSGLIMIYTGYSGFCKVPEKYGAESLSKRFYSQALLASWMCRLERIAKSPENERNGQYARLTEVTFRYWVYSRNDVLERDVRFENLLYEQLIIKKTIPSRFLESPLEGELVKVIPGYKWTDTEYSEISENFKKFIDKLQYAKPSD